MNNEEQRIAIAEACGLGDYGTSMIGWYKDQIAALPDYLNDLNAMHEAEKVLTVKQATQFASVLGEVILDYGCGDYRENMYMLYCVTHATAAQRAEAFLRTLKLWEE